jgi:hypothetical protein
MLAVSASKISIHSVTHETLTILHSANDKLDSIHLDDYYDSYHRISGYLDYSLRSADPAGHPAGNKVKGACHGMPVRWR